MPKTKTRKKAAVKKNAAPRTAKKKTSKKAAGSAKASRLQKSRQMVDDVLVKVSPQVQKRVDQLISTLHDTKEARMGDLKWLAGQILLRSRDISAQIKKVSKQKSARAARVTTKKASKVAIKKDDT